MKRFLRLFLLSILFSFSVVFSASSQGLSFYVNGKIISEVSKKPIQLAELFISGSSVGTASDEKGNFRINVPFTPCYLVVTHSDYDPFAVYIEEPTDSMRIAMTPFSIDRNEYPVLSKSERKKEVRFFCQQLIGEDQQTSYDILNASVLNFSRDERTFRATSNIPLVVINHTLGYKIKALIREFYITKRDDVTHDDVPLNSYAGSYARRIMGHYYYEPLQGSEAQLKRYEKARQMFYYGSCRHFLKALYDGEIMEQGYQLSFFPPEAIRDGITFTNLNSLRSSPGRIKQCLMDADSLKVDFYHDANGLPINLTKSFETYTKEISVIFPSSIPVRIRPNGTTPNIPFEVKGRMEEIFFINALPDDYEPPVIEKSPDSEKKSQDNNTRIQELIKQYKQQDQNQN